MTGHSRLAVIWIDWYAYHIARFRALAEHPMFQSSATGIELVGGDGVHAGQQFRDAGRQHLSITTIEPDANWSTISQWRLATGVWKHLGELRPSLVLVPGYYTLPALAAAVWGRLHAARTVLMSESTEADHARTPWKEAVKGFVVRHLFHYAIVGGSRHQEYLQGLGFDEAKIGLRYNVVDNTFFTDGVQALRASGRPAGCDLPEHYFVYVGRLADEKNLERLLRAFASYRRQGGQWRLVLVGDGPRAAALAALARELGASADVAFAGHRSTGELLPFYAFASAFVLPSLREPWGLVVNEAMASALPVIVSRVCGAAGDVVIEGQNGFTFDARSEDQLTALLLRMSRSNRETLRAMGQRSLDIIQEFSPSRWAAEVARLANI